MKCFNKKREEKKQNRTVNVRRSYGNPTFTAFPLNSYDIIWQFHALHKLRLRSYIQYTYAKPSNWYTYTYTKAWRSNKIPNGYNILHLLFSRMYIPYICLCMHILVFYRLINLMYLWNHFNNFCLTLWFCVFFSFSFFLLLWCVP